MLSRFINILRRVKGRLIPHQVEKNSWEVSETSKCRTRLAPYCEGYGVDVGFGGDSITSTAIRVDMATPYANVGEQGVQLGGGGDHLYWFSDGVLDYVYSSHLLEDFPNVEAVLREWIRVVKTGGRLILYCPDEQRFRKHCSATGQPTNPAHKHEEFSIQYVIDALAIIGQEKIIYRNDFADIYSWELVVEKV